MIEINIKKTNGTDDLFGSEFVIRAGRKSRHFDTKDAAIAACVVVVDRLAAGEVETSEGEGDDNAE